MSTETINDLKLVQIAQEQLKMNTKKREVKKEQKNYNLNGTFINC